MREPEPVPGAAPARQRKSILRRVTGWLISVVLICLILLEIAWLARGPLFDRIVAPRVSAMLATALDGKVHMRGLRGNLWSGIGLEDFNLEDGKGVVRGVRGLRLQARYDVFELIRGNLEGIRDARVVADEVVIDLDAPSSTTDTPTSEEPTDFAAILDLLPRDAELRVAKLIIHGSGETLAGPALVRIAPASTDRRRATLTIEAPAIGGRGWLDFDKRVVRLDANIPRVERVTRLFLGAGTNDSGQLATSVTAELSSPPSVRAQLRLAGATVGQDTLRRLGLETATATRVPKLETRVSLRNEVVRVALLDLDADGVHVHANQIMASIGGSSADLLESLNGSIYVRIDDPKPWLAYAPTGLRSDLEPFLPLTAGFEAHCETGRIEIREGRIDARGTKLSLSSTPFDAFRAKSDVVREGEIRFAVDISERAPLQPFLGEQVRVSSASARGNLRIQGNDWRGECSIGLEGSATERDVSCSGQLGFEIRDALDVDPSVPLRASLTPDVIVSGKILRQIESLRLGGKVDLEGSRLRLENLDVIQRRGGATLGKLLVNANVALAGDLVAQARSSEVDVRIEDFEVAFLSPLLPEEALSKRSGDTRFGGRTNGRVTWAPATSQLTANLQGKLAGLALEAVDFSLATVSDQTATKLERIDVRIGDNTVDVSGTANGLDLLQILAGKELSAVPLSLAGTLKLASIPSLELERFGVADPTGTLAGNFEVEGTFGAPRARASLDLAAIGATIGTTKLHAATGKLVATNESLEIPELAFVLDDLTHTLRLRAKRTAESFDLEQFEYLQNGAPTMTATARVLANSFDQIAAAIEKNTRLDVTLRALDVDPFLGDPSTRDALGTIDGKVTFESKPGSAPNLSGDLGIAITAPQHEQILDVAVSLVGNDKLVGLEAVRLTARNPDKSPNGRESAAMVSGHALLGTALAQLLADPARIGDVIRAADLDVNLDLKAVDLQRVDAGKLGLADLTGSLDGEVRVTGSIDKPVPLVTLAVVDTGVRVRGTQRIESLNGKLIVDASSVRVEKLTGSIGAAPIVIDGDFRASGPLIETYKDGVLDFKITGKNTLLTRKDGVRVRADLDLHAKGKASKIEIGGSVALVQSKVVGRIPFINVSRAGGVAVRQGIEIPGIELPEGMAGTFNLSITTKDPIDVKTNVYSGGVTVALDVKGALDAPLILGTISSVARKNTDARLKLPGVSMRLTTMLVTFDRDSPRFPRVNIVASGRRHGYDVQMIVRGRYDRPEVLFSSNPPLPSEDLAVLVATGQRPQALRQSGVRGVGSLVGSYIVEELADYLFGSESTEAKESFLERFTLETGTEISANGNESIVVEFRAFPRVWLQGERDVYEDINFGIVYRFKFK